MVPCQTQACEQADELLLDAVVQVPLEPAAGGVVCLHQPHSRCRQLLETVGQLSCELRVADRKSRLPPERGQELLVGGDIGAF